jgi:hypothetical protein
MDTPNKKVELMIEIRSLSVLSKVSEIKVAFIKKTPGDLKEGCENRMTLEETKAEIHKSNQKW